MKRSPQPLAAGQESVWDYPRPPRLEPCTARIRIVTAGNLIAESTGSFRVLETSHPPVYYIPPEHVAMNVLKLSERQSFCEWKGLARYYDLALDNRQAKEVAWFYPRPTPQFAPIANYLAFYPSKMDACCVDDEQALAQEGDFYGGWITSNIVGPFKGGPGTRGW